ncbi:MAG: DUF2795 domain-containing protein [Candidatus Dojkabacteria bacterium]
MIKETGVCELFNLKERRIMAVSAKYIKGAGFPHTKDELIQLAQSNGAPEEVINSIRHMEDRNYNSPVDVEKEFSSNE